MNTLPTQDDMKKRNLATFTLLLAALSSTMAQMQSAVLMPDDGPTTVEKLPSAVLDLTNWKLNIPVADANGYSKEIVQPDLNDYADDNFHVNASGDAVVFRAHANGATTKGSSYPRSELREMQNNGKDKASWSIASGGGTHTMQITQAVTHLPTQKRHVVVGQIHDADDDVIVFRLENKKLFIDHNGKDGPVLTSDYQLGTKFTVKFVAGGEAVRCYYNGTFVESYPSTATGCYFKAGMYTQSKPTEKGGRENAEDAEAYGEAEVYQLTVTHDYAHDPTDDTATALVPLPALCAASSAMFNLQGIPLHQSPRGIVIQNGRKVLRARLNP